MHLHRHLLLKRRRKYGDVESPVGNPGTGVLREYELVHGRVAVNHVPQRTGGSAERAQIWPAPLYA